jgi:predicted transposase YbfD/YdcC
MFEELPDPRASNCVHPLSSLLYIALAASLCGAQSATEMAIFARSKKSVLEELIGPFTPPSHDTFSRVFRLLDAKAFAEAFAVFQQRFHQALAGVVAIDGKAMRRAFETGRDFAPPIMVSAWSTEVREVLGAYRAGPAGEGEAETAVRLIGLLRLEGCTVTADALHCHRRMAEAVRARGGDYVLTLKGNQSGIKRDVEAALSDAAAMNKTETACTDEIVHGRRERRSAMVIPLPGLAEKHRFEGLAAAGVVVAERNGGKPHRRLFLLSRELSPEELLAVTRSHWAVENSLHWCLDVHFAEDACRARKDNAPANYALLLRIARSILSRMDDKASVRGRLKKCGWNDDYLKQALAHMR